MGVPVFHSWTVWDAKLDIGRASEKKAHQEAISLLLGGVRRWGPPLRQGFGRYFLRFFHGPELTGECTSESSKSQFHRTAAGKLDRLLFLHGRIN